MSFLQNRVEEEIEAADATSSLEGKRIHTELAHAYEQQIVNSDDVETEDPIQTK